MKETILVVGGCRSGKSRRALELAESYQHARKIFIATCMPHDEEMQMRVQRHQAERDKSWHTVEAPVQLPQAVVAHGTDDNVVLVDCLTLWTSNLLMETDQIDAIEGYIQELTAALNRTQCPVVLVSNEVGTGIVPENRLARLFRDANGLVNQRVAACANQVVWMVAGIPVPIKPPQNK